MYDYERIFYHLMLCHIRPKRNKKTLEKTKKKTCKTEKETESEHNKQQEEKH